MIPNNGVPAGSTYAARIAAGGTYTLTLDTPVTVDRVELSAAGATLRIASNLTLLGPLDRTAGTLQLFGGSISGGTLNMNGATLQIHPGAALNRLNNVNVNGSVGFTSIAFSNSVLEASGSIGGALMLNAFTSSGAIVTTRVTGPLNVGGQVTINGSNILDLATGFSHAGVIQLSGGTVLGGGDLTVAPGGTLRGNGTVSCAQLINNGIVETTAGQPLLIRSGGISGTGLLRATGGMLDLFGSAPTPWSAAGLQLQGGDILLGGIVTTAGLGTVTRTSANGVLALVGSLNNAGATLDLTGGVGSLTMRGGTLSGGSINLDPGAAIIGTTNNPGGLLLDTTVNGRVDLGANAARLHIGGSVTVNGQILIGRGSTLYAQGNATLAGADVLFTPLAPQNGRIFDAEGHPPSSLTLAPSTMVSALGGTIGTLSTTTLVNQGLIRADGANSKIFLTPVSLLNQGTLQVSNGGTLTLGTGNTNSPTDWSNPGTIIIDGGRFELGGRISSANLGNISRAGGVVSLFGEIINTGLALTLDAGTGSWEANNNRITGGTINLTQGSTILFNGAGETTGNRSATFVGVTLNGDLELPHIAGFTNQRPRLFVDGGLLLNGTIATRGQDAKVQFRGDQTINGGTYVIEGPAGPSLTAGLFLANSSTDSTPSLTIGPDTLIRGGRGYVRKEFQQVGPTTLVNHGRISADLTGQPLIVQADTVTNHGTLEAINGGSLTVSGSALLELGGTLRVNNSSVLLATPIQVGVMRFLPGFAIDRTGGSIGLSGNLDNQGNTLVLDASTGSWFAQDIHIHGGTVRYADGQAFAFRTPLGGEPNAGLHLHSATLDGTLVVPNINNNNNALVATATGDLTVTGAIRITNNLFGFGNGGSGVPQNFYGTIIGAASGISSTGNDPGGVSLDALGTLILAPGSVVRGGKLRLGASGPTTGQGTLINRGQILADEPDRRIAFQATRFINEGLVEASNGGTFWMGQNNDASIWSNTGTMRAASGGELMLGGSTRTADLGTIVNDGGTVTLARFLDNTNATLTLSSQTGSWWLGSQGGVIKNGTVQTLDSTSLQIGGGGILDGVTLNGRIDVAGRTSLSGGGARLAIRNGLFGDPLIVLGRAPGGTVANVGSVAFEGNQTFQQGTILFDSSGGGDRRVLSGDTAFPRTFTLGAGVLVHGGNGRISNDSERSVINHGTISADVPGESILVNTHRFANTGTIQAVNGGEIIFDPPLGPGGAGGGVLEFVMEATGVLAVGAGSVMSITGDLSMSPHATVRIALGGEHFTFRPIGRIWVAEHAALSGTLVVTMPERFTPVVGERLRIMAWGSRSGQFDTVHLPPLPEALSWDTRSLYDDGVIGIVPGPAPAGVLILAGAAALRRRRVPRQSGGVR